ncbi:hypothetical protein A0H81_13874 [Grifola frondosa]|uniref:Uncharacterized protein n=1 Tax=Grifola frondosa TaxID=5627 RepID=A0A1C7LQK5_GRIFR|nr:hypothetical protein A0H81_13874 [Grifola frondosa]
MTAKLSGITPGTTATPSAHVKHLVPIITSSGETSTRNMTIEWAMPAPSVAYTVYHPSHKADSEAKDRGTCNVCHEYRIGREIGDMTEIKKYSAERDAKYDQNTMMDVETSIDAATLGRNGMHPHIAATAGRSTPSAKLSVTLDSSGVAGFFGGDEAVSAMATVHVYGGRKWLGWYNSPGSYEIAKRYGQLANSRFWDGLFPGINVDPAQLFELDGYKGPNSRQRARAPSFRRRGTRLSDLEGVRGCPVRGSRGAGDDAQRGDHSRSPLLSTARDAPETAAHYSG